MGYNRIEDLGVKYLAKALISNKVKTNFLLVVLKIYLNNLRRLSLHLILTEVESQVKAHSFLLMLLDAIQ